MNNIFFIVEIFQRGQIVHHEFNDQTRAFEWAETGLETGDIGTEIRIRKEMEE